MRQETHTPSARQELCHGFADRYAFDVTRELSELTEVLVEHRVHSLHLDLRMAADEHVSKASQVPQVAS